ncbi:MAG: hypothetical protein HW416_301 [Chloroflexi bacterium]|nr:hypothetical protein [Chloroflexota bacterium]
MQLGPTGIDLSAEPDYVLVGHVTRDLFGVDQRLGGTVLYAGVAAARLGRRVGIVTAFETSLVLPPEAAGLAVSRAASDRTTTFRIDHVGGGRRLSLLDRAPRIECSDAPQRWRRSPIVHLAPVADETSPELAACFPKSWTGATAQGWLRDPYGDVTTARWSRSAAQLGNERFGAIVVSDDDLRDNSDVGLFTQHAECVVVTHGASGCTVHVVGQTIEVPACAADEVDSTGAGDVFAAAFFVRLNETRDPVSSARFAACAAGLSIEGVGLSRIPTREQVVVRLAMGG